MTRADSRRRPGGKPRTGAPAALCGRADLVRALAEGGRRQLRAVAARLGYAYLPADCRVDADGTGRGADAPAEQGRAPRPPSVLPPHPAPAAPLPLWQPVAREQLALPESAAPDGPTELPRWKGRPRQLTDAPELASWADLLPRLRQRMGAISASRAVDIPRLVRDLSRARQPQRLPRRQRRRWGGELCIIEDRSQRLTPYWADQARLSARLKRLLPGYAVHHALFQEGHPEPADAYYPLDAPPSAGALVLVLGDLGCLAPAGSGADTYWRTLGQRLAALDCRLLAISPAHRARCPSAVAMQWPILPWERGVGADPARCGAQLERLVTLASMASRIEPGLLRRLRRLIAADAASESEFWQHPALSGRLSVAAVIAPEEVRQRRPALAREDRAIKRAALRAVRDQRVTEYDEVWLGEVGALAAGESVLLPARDLSDARGLIAALGRQAAGSGGASLTPGALAWFRLIAERFPAEILDDPELGPHLHALWNQVRLRCPQACLPDGLHPAQLSDAAPPRTLQLRQAGGRLTAAVLPGHGDRAGDSLLAEIDSAGGVLRVEEGRRPDRQAFWKGGKAPVWADDWGRDEYGPWVSFSMTASDGFVVSQRMRWIAPGTFRMGSPGDEYGRYSDEGPAHPVTIRRGYWLFDTACTQELWQAVMGGNPSRGRGAQRPVESVSWKDSQSFIRQINEALPGLGLDLPSEAQWEYACRAGTGTPFSFGDDISPEQVNYDGEHPYHKRQAKGLNRRRTVPVASLPPNRWGLHEMHGNVWEWTADAWQENYQGAPADGSARAGKREAARTVRGGSWRNHARYVRSAVRRAHDPGNRYDNRGLRPARDQQDPPAEPAAIGSEGGGAAPRTLQLSPAGHGAIALPRSRAFSIISDREALRFALLRHADCGWASALGRDHFGLWAEIRVEADSGPPVTQRLRWVPPGRFRKGSSDDEPGHRDNEGPVHEVSIEQGYWLFDTPCTQALWQAVMGDNPSHFQSPDRPVEQVDWDAVQGFFKAINQRIPSLALNLPSEAQWEYACRSGTNGPLYSGPMEIIGTNNAPALDAISWYAGNSGVGFELDNGYDSSSWPDRQYPDDRAGTHPVALKRPNSWGLYDMLGNVWEWTADVWQENYEGAPVDGSARLGQPGADRVIRGGSWNDFARDCRSAYRYRYQPDYRYINLGFRCARAQGS